MFKKNFILCSLVVLQTQSSQQSSASIKTDTNQSNYKTSGWYLSADSKKEWMPTVNMITLLEKQAQSLSITPPKEIIINGQSRTPIQHITYALNNPNDPIAKKELVYLGAMSSMKDQGSILRITQYGLEAIIMGGPKYYSVQPNGFYVYTQKYHEDLDKNRQKTTPLIRLSNNHVANPSECDRTVLSFMKSLRNCKTQNNAPQLTNLPERTIRSFTNANPQAHVLEIDTSLEESSYPSGMLSSPPIPIPLQSRPRSFSSPINAHRQVTSPHYAYSSTIIAPRIIQKTLTQNYTHTQKIDSKNSDTKDKCIIS